MLSRAILQTEFDSGSLSATGTVAHRLPDPGVYEVEAVDTDGRFVKRCEVVVREGVRASASIELRTGDGASEDCGAGDVVLAPNGMLSFRAPDARRGIIVRLARRGQRAPEWDSRMLEPGDLFACMPMRPGRYGVYGEAGEQRPRFHLRVCYPDPRAVAQGRKLRSGSVGIDLDPVKHIQEVEIDPGQAVMFAIEKKGRVRIRLEEADDGPPELAAWREARSREALYEALKRWTRARKVSAE